MNKHFKSLELDKILNKLSTFASCADAKEACLSLGPETDLTVAKISLARTDEAFRLVAQYGSPSFGGLRNCSNALAVADAGGIIGRRDLLNIAENLRVIRSLRQWRDNQDHSSRFQVPGSRSAEVGDSSGSESENSELRTQNSELDLFFGGLMPNRYLEDKITVAITPEEEIADGASPLLAEIRRQIRAKSAGIREKLEHTVHSAAYRDMLQDAIITQRNGRFVVPVKAEYRSRFGGLVHDTSSSGSTVFIEPMAVVEANNEIRVLEGKEQQEIERIISALCAEAGSFKDELNAGYECAVELDVIFAKAQLAYDMRAGLPELCEEGGTDLRGARHPLLDKTSVVPIDIRVGGDYDTLVITGPNTGGKTVALKTLGLLTLMAECGLMLPAREGSRVRVYKNIFADIGDEQSIEQSLSTFSAHMVNIVSILKEADFDSLVLIDELGAGTDPVEGAALAMAILEKLRMQGATIAATTHYAELKAYALDTPRVENGSCEFDVETLRPTYRLLIGIPGRSNAFAISERLGIAPEVIDRAKELVSAENTRFEDVVDDLERRRKSMEQADDDAQRMRREAEEKLRQAETKLDDLDNIREKEIDRATAEARRIVEGAKRASQDLLAEIDSLKKELRRQNANPDFLQKAKSDIRRGLDAAYDAAASPLTGTAAETSEPEEIRKGDTVRFGSTGATGTVLTEPDKKGYVEISMGSGKMRAKASDLRKVKAPAPKKNDPDIVFKTESRATAAVSSRCDLRGMNTEEALEAVEEFLDSLAVAGLPEGTIIHGKGTGTLRKAVTKRLSGHRHVKAFRLGKYGEGEDGVTIVTMK